MLLDRREEQQTAEKMTLAENQKKTMEFEFSNVGILGTKSFDNFLLLFERGQNWEILQFLQRHPFHQKNFQKSL
jgi:hypothetical protein